MDWACPMIDKSQKVLYNEYGSEHCVLLAISYANANAFAEDIRVGMYDTEYFAHFI